MSLLIRDVFLRDPTEFDIPNDGVAKVGEPETDQQWRVLEHELSTFVCKGEYERGLYRILNSFVTHQDQSSQPAAWVSGFYGSGKSHLVRVLEQLWRDTTFPDGDTARNMVKVTREIDELLRELTTVGTQRGGLWSAAGTLSSSGDVGVRLAILAVILRAAKLPEAYAQAQLVLRLKHEGVWDAVAANLTGKSRDIDYELENMYVSLPLHAAILEAYPGFAQDTREVRELVRSQFPRRTDISNQEFVDTIEAVLDLVTDTEGKRPCALVVLDELQQFISNDPQIALEVQEAVETCCTHFGSSLLIVATGQAQLAASAQLQRLMGRFTIQVHLQDVDIEEVIREVVLQKKETYRDEIDALLEATSGEIHRQLRGTPFAIRSEDDRHLVSDYPLLPSRRRFWEAVLRAVDTGTTGQLRTQMRIVHSASADIAPRPLGAVIPGDRIFQHIQSGVLNSGALQREVSNKIDELLSGDEEQRLRGRLSATIFLIERVATESATPTGLKPTADLLADLLVEDLTAGSAAFRQRVADALEPMVEDGTLERVNDEYHLQTAEGAEWERDFKARESRIRNDDVRIPSDRANALRAAVAAALNPVKGSLRQGVSNEKRDLVFHYGDELPETAEGVPVWVPISWSLTENQLLAQAAAAGSTSPIIFVHLPRKNADAIREALASFGAAQETLTNRGGASVEASQGEVQARAGMTSRRDLAQARLTGLIAEILADARVFQGGGNEIAEGGNLASNVRIAADHALDRLYTMFHYADHGGWATVFRRANQGSQNALEAVDHTGQASSHPVCSHILSFVGGAGKRGAEVRQHFGRPPYGWPRDTVDGALMALLAVDAVTARYQGEDASVARLNQSTLSQAEFRVPDADEMPTAQERISVRGFIHQVTGLNPKPAEVAEETLSLLNALLGLASEAGGGPPLPSRPDTTTINELRTLTGNRRVKAVASHLETLKADHETWKQRKQAIATRLPTWRLLERMLRIASDANLPVAPDASDQVDAILANRSLLADPDPVRPLADALGQALRDRLHELHRELERARRAEIEVLGQMPEWDQVASEHTDGIVQRVGLRQREVPDVSTDEQLVEALTRTPLEMLEQERFSIATKANQARVEIIQAATPQAVEVTLPRRTLSTPEEIDAWLAETGALLREQMTKDGVTRPVIV